MMIEVEKLRRSFGPIVAVNGITFQADKGDVLGFLGPNGAGKSTAMKMLACFLDPDGGTARVCGHDIRQDPVGVRSRLGYLAENAPAYGEMTVDSFLRFVCDAREIVGRARKVALGRVVELCGLGRVYHQSVETLSKGYVRRVGLAQALIHDPPVLILDEPTDGLDPNQKREVRRLIERMAQDKCIVISTHILEEVDAVCTRMIVIAQGRIRVDSTPAELKSQYHGDLNEVFRKLTTEKKSA